MHLHILAASGGTGQELTRQALERGHTVTAIARAPARIEGPDSPQLTRVAADVREPASVQAALKGAEVVLSGLGVAKGERPGTLAAGAMAVVAARPGRILWLGAIGSGRSARAAGPLVPLLFRLVPGMLRDKVTADAAVLDAGGTVFHAGPLSDGPIAPGRRTVGVGDVPRRVFPAGVSRATVAAAMLDEAESPRFGGAVAVPLER